MKVEYGSAGDYIESGSGGCGAVFGLMFAAAVILGLCALLGFALGAGIPDEWEKTGIAEFVWVPILWHGEALLTWIGECEEG